MHRTQGPHRAEEREVALSTTLCPRAGEAFCLSELWRSVPWALVCPHMLWEAVGQAESPTENRRSSSEATEHEIPGVVRRSVHTLHCGPGFQLRSWCHSRERGKWHTASPRGLDPGTVGTRPNPLSWA